MSLLTTGVPAIFERNARLVEEPQLEILIPCGQLLDHVEKGFATRPWRKGRIDVVDQSPEPIVQICVISSFLSARTSRRSMTHHPRCSCPDPSPPILPLRYDR